MLLQSFTLDDLGRAVVTRDLNDPTISADDGLTRARFDSFGHVTHQGFSGDAAAAQWTVVASFDPAGRRTSIVTSAFGATPATTMKTNLDLLGRPTSVIDEHGTNPDETIASFGFIGFDRLVEQSRGDGTTWQAHDGSQDFFDFATRRTGARITNGAGSILFEEQIRYDQRNEVRAVVWSHGRAGNDSEAQTYAFDELGRLIDFKQGLWDPNANSGVGAIAAGDPNLTAARSWQLDVLGNWRAHDPSGDGQGPLQPQLDAVNAYTHFPAVVDTDANGSPDTLQQLPLTYDEARGFLFERVEQLSGTTAVKTIEYQHDLLGRLVQVTRKTSGIPTVLAQYGYLADGRLAWRCPGVCDGSGGPRRWLVYDGSQPIHEGTGAAGVAPEWSYVWLGSTLLKATGSSAGERFVHHDRLGSVVMETRSSAGSVQVLGRATYDPYGRPTAIPSWSGASLQVPYGYAGARREDAAGLYLMGARWYDPTLGRFIEQDPIGELGGVNLYAYTGSSPISWTDPSGLYTKGGKNRLAYGGNECTAPSTSWRPHSIGNKATSYRTMDRAPGNASLIATHGMGWFMGSQNSPLYQTIQAADRMSWRNWSASAARPAEMSALQGMNGSALAEGGSSEPAKGKTVTWQSDTVVTVEDDGIDDPWLDAWEQVYYDEVEKFDEKAESPESIYGPRLPQPGDERDHGTIWVTFHGLYCGERSCLAYHSALEYNGETLSAGPEWSGWDGLVLKSRGGRDTDKPANNKTLGYVVPPRGKTPEAYWKVLQGASDAYSSSPRDYDAIRADMESEGWNCNSFTVGVVSATEGTMVPTLEPGLFPGADFPLPKDAFESEPSK